MECKAVSRPDEESENERIWKLLSEAGLLEIAIDDFPSRIKEAKDIVMGRLGELLAVRTETQECQSAAYSLATLKELENTLGRSGKRQTGD